MDEIRLESGVITVLQTRMQPCDLPGRPMLPLGKGSVLDAILQRIQSAIFGFPLVMVTSSEETDRPLVRFCEEREIPCVAGDPNDMLANVLIAARSQEARTVIRVLDNQPLLDPRMLDACARYALDSGMDYVRVARLPGGVSAEAMLVRTLERSASLTQDAGDRANVTSFALSHPEMFERAFLPPPQRLARPDLNLALNSEADYALLGRLFREVPACMNGLIRLEDAIAWTDTHGDQAREIGPRLAA